MSNINWRLLHKRKYCSALYMILPKLHSHKFPAGILMLLQPYNMTPHARQIFEGLISYPSIYRQKIEMIRKTNSSHKLSSIPLRKYYCERALIKPVKSTPTLLTISWHQKRVKCHLLRKSREAFHTWDCRSIYII